MTPDQLEELSDMIAKKVLDNLNLRFNEDPNWKVMGPEEFLSKDIDAFGNPKVSPKDLLEQQMYELRKTGEKLLREEKYELLRELKEIYDKIKAEWGKL